MMPRKWEWVGLVGWKRKNKEGSHGGDHIQKQPHVSSECAFRLGDFKPGNHPTTAVVLTRGVAEFNQGYCFSHW
jgi:hypothetical protein